MSKYIRLMFTAFLQVYFVGISTIFLARGIVFSAFVVSYIWTLNVKRIYIANLVERLLYATSAAAGSLIAYKTSYIIIKTLNTIIYEFQI